MPIIKEKIKFNNQDVVLKINLGVGNNVLGYQQEIDNITEDIKEDLINPVIDYEVSRFKYNSDEVTTTYLYFNFIANGSTTINSFLTSGGAGFTLTEVSQKSKNVLNSFFIGEIYDSYDFYTQTKICTTYNTQILEGNTYLGLGLPIPSYDIDNSTSNQFNVFNIPKWFIDEQTGSTVTVYLKYSYYCAKNGSVALFYNEWNNTTELSKTPQLMYFKVILDIPTMTWKFDITGIEFPTTINAKQLPYTNLYSQQVNSGVDNFDNEQQVFPSGNTFIKTTGKYNKI